jgi:hypothetical protein
MRALLPLVFVACGGAVDTPKDHDVSSLAIPALVSERETTCAPTEDGNVACLRDDSPEALTCTVLDHVESRGATHTVYTCAERPACLRFAFADRLDCHAYACEEDVAPPPACRPGGQWWLVESTGPLFCCN